VWARREPVGPVLPPPAPRGTPAWCHAARAGEPRRRFSRAAPPPAVGVRRDDQRDDEGEGCDHQGVQRGDLVEDERLDEPRGGDDHPEQSTTTPAAHRATRRPCPELTLRLLHAPFDLADRLLESPDALLTSAYIAFASRDIRLLRPLGRADHLGALLQCPGRHDLLLRASHDRGMRIVTCDAASGLVQPHSPLDGLDGHNPCE
jgi:hypothetical protein